jgi:Ca2+-binding EF-hand superfamily protein
LVHVNQAEEKLARSFINEWFNKADKDLNGILNMNEAQTILSKFNQQLLQNTGINKEKLLELFNSTDTNGDNTLSLDEFKNAVLKNIQKLMAIKKKI